MRRGCRGAGQSAESEPSKRRQTVLIVLIVLLLIAFVAVALWQRRERGSEQAQEPEAPVLGERTKSEDCRVRGPLPDHACTPGTIFVTATREKICTPGYAKSVRNVPEAVKNQVYREYGIPSHQPGQYEVDHLVSLELGGSNDIANLWPEAAEPRPGFHEKDRYENFVHEQICRGEISLQEGQRRIAEDWLKHWTDAGRP